MSIYFSEIYTHFLFFSNLKRLYLIKRQTLSQLDIVEMALSHKKKDFKPFQILKYHIFAFEFLKFGQL